MTSKVLIIASILFLSLGLSVFAQANILTNPGFETGDFTGWECSYNPGLAVVTDQNAHSGSYHARLYDYTEIYQYVDVTPYELYKLAAWTYMPDGEVYGAGIFLDFYDENEQYLDDWMQTVDQLPRNQYNKIESYWLTAPEDAATAKIYSAIMGPTYMDLDDFDFSPIPEPSSLLLLGTGLLSIFGFGIRRKK